MAFKKETALKIIDSAIFVFIIIFLLSISNSIFVNQLGYYGALILILIKAAINKENQFSKTGLEFALLWYLLAEVLSTIFSNDQSSAFHNLLKRAFLIPIIYTMIASIKDLKDAKTFFKIYIGGTLITVLIYLYFSFQYYINDLYGSTESGPSIFQYPITASEIISFTVIFLFAFLINEKTSIRNRILLFVGFSLSMLALFSTYKRTGWMGAAFGILIILIMKKQWKILLTAAALIVVFLITQKNISEITIYKVQPDTIKQESTLITDGKAYDIYPLNDELIVADYNNGLSVIKDDSILQNLELPSAVVSIKNWKDDYYLAGLADTRFILLKRKSGKFNVVNELYSPGYTSSQALSNKIFYILDVDSGLTVFTNPDDLSKKLRFNQFSKYSSVFADSSFVILGEASKGFTICSTQNGFITKNIIAQDSSSLSFIYYSNSFLFTEHKEGMNIYKVDDDGIKLLQKLTTLKKIVMMNSDNNKFVAVNTSGEVFILQQDSINEFKVIANLELNYLPKAIYLNNNELYVSRVENKQSRLLGIFDPYHPSNSNRLAFWRAGIKIFKDYPLFGVGDIDLQKLYRQYKRPFDKEIQGHLHNNFFHVLATLGLFGLLAVLFLFYKIISIDLKIYRSIKDQPFISSYALGALSAFCGFLISGLTELNFWDHEITTLIWFTFGLNIAFFKSINQDKTN